MLLFRRRPREKEMPAEERPEGPAAGSPGTTGKTRPEAPPGAPPGTPPPAPSTGPPPLPRKAPEGTGPSGVPAPFSRCFVCGTTLEAGTCPVCKIAWVE